MTAPLAFQFFAKENPSEVVKRGLAVMKVTTANLKELKQINTLVNKKIKPRVDKSDKYSLFPVYGDCEDYAISKRHMLISAGFSPSALRLASCKLISDETHMVLILKTTQGDLVLDNLSNFIIQRKDCHYKFLSIMSDDPMIWVDAD